MPEYIVRETLTTLRYVEAESEEKAIEIAKERDCGDFDEIDPAVAQVFSAKLGLDAEPKPADEVREEPIWTGRYGQDRLDVIENGQDFHVFNIINAADPSGNGVMIFGPEALPIRPDTVEGWVDNVVIRAYNAEDAMRNAPGALAQWHVWFNEYDDLNWETAPFTDEAGNFPDSGGDRGDGFDAYPPDATAAGGITRPDLFAYGGGFLVPASVVLERSEVRVGPRP